MTERDIEALRVVLCGMISKDAEPEAVAVVEAALALVCGLAKDISRIADALEHIAVAPK